jgi:mannonate dehydratase
MMFLHQAMRWYGPHDVVSLRDIRQAGCAGVVTALHQIPVGDAWPVEEIMERKKLVEGEGMSWTVIESLPVSEDIKRQTGEWKKHIENYKSSIRHLAACGLKVITYNCMPVLDWIRTDISYPMPDGALALYFNRSDFIAFDLFQLKRPGALKDYSAEEIKKAEQRFNETDKAHHEKVFRNCLLGLPGSNESFTREMVLEELTKYENMDAQQLKQNLFHFLCEVIPVCEETGMVMAIHPDDPPYPVLGLPRIMSSEKDAADLFAAIPSQANGLCFCTGSFGASPDNDIIKMLQRFGDRIHFLHLRNTKRDAEGNFYEARHLEGDTDMFSVMKEVIKIQRRRNISLPMRPDHGHQILDDLHKKTFPGYTAIGRLKGLAELRGLELGISRSM